MIHPELAARVNQASTRGKGFGYFSFPNSVLASFKMVMFGSASFHSLRKSWYAALDLAVSPAIA